MIFILWIVSTGVLGTVIILYITSRHIMCDLCMLQSVPWVLLWIITTFSSCKGTCRYMRSSVRIISQILMLFSIGLSFYHIGVIHKWWMAHCTAIHIPSIEIFKQNTFHICTQEKPPVFGLFSLPMDNFLISCAIFLLLFIWPKKRY